MNNALTTSDLADNLHPNDGGYIKMAETYFSAIEKANSLGLISKAGTLSDPPTDATTPENCRRHLPGTMWARWQKVPRCT
ncbi:hypothetical protein V1522DRAFT_294302 [Lipomyces starkeyi]